MIYTCCLDKRCRKKYCNPQTIARDTKHQEAVASKRQVLLSEDKFCFNSNCFFCGQPAMIGNKRKGFDVVSVRTVELKNTILAVCRERKDAWANGVQARISSAHDLHAADAVYHKSCDINFRTMRQIPTSYKNEKVCSKKLKLGRPYEEERTEAFLEVVHFLEENDDEQITVNDLMDKMEDILDGSEYCAYTRKHMQSKLEEHFGDSIVITHVNGKSNVVTFGSTAKAVLQEFCNSQQKSDPNTEKLWFVQTAAKLTMSDIKSVETSHGN